MRVDCPAGAVAPDRSCRTMLKNEYLIRLGAAIAMQIGGLVTAGAPAPCTDASATGRAGDGKNRMAM